MDHHSKKQILLEENFTRLYSLGYTRSMIKEILGVGDVALRNFLDKNNVVLEKDILASQITRENSKIFYILKELAITEKKVQMEVNFLKREIKTLF